MTWLQNKHRLSKTFSRNKVGKQFKEEAQLFNKQNFTNTTMCFIGKE